MPLEPSIPSRGRTRRLGKWWVAGWVAGWVGYVFWFPDFFPHVATNKPDSFVEVNHGPHSSLNNQLRLRRILKL